MQECSPKHEVALKGTNMRSWLITFDWGKCEFLSKWAIGDWPGIQVNSRLGQIVP